MNTSSHTRGGRAAARLAFVLVATSSVASIASAAVSVGSAQVGGFFSQGYLTTSNDVNYPAETVDGTFEFREAALNASMPLGSKIRVGAQIFEQRLGDYGDDKIILDWASIDYNAAPEFGIRAGRVKLPRGLYNEALDVDLVRPFIFLPMGLYDPRLRDFNASFDGGMIYGSLEFGEAGSLDYKFFCGDMPVSVDEGSGVADFFRNSGLIEPTDASIDLTYGAWLFWNTSVSGLRFGLSYSVIDGLLASGPFTALPVAEVVVGVSKNERIILSAEYVTGDWTFAAEYGNESSPIEITVPMLGVNQEDEIDWSTWYISAARRIGEHVEVGAYYSQFHSEGETIDQQDDLAASVRWDINEHVLVKVEAHFIDGQNRVFNTPSAPNPNRAANESFTLLAAKMTLSF